MKKKVLIILCIALAVMLVSCGDVGTYVEETGQHPTDTSSPEITADLAGAEYDASLYGGLDIDLTFWRKGFDNPTGIWGTMPDYFAEEPKVETLDGDIYVNYTGIYKNYFWDGFTLKTYMPDADGEFSSLYEIRTERDDIYTYRGIHVGSTLAEVIETYKGEMPSETVYDGRVEYQDKEYWGSYAPHLYFYIEDDVVVAMELKYSVQRSPQKIIHFDDCTLVFDTQKTNRGTPIDTIISVDVDNTLTNSLNENAEVKDVFETEKYYFVNVKQDSIYDVLIYDKEAKQSSWLSGAESFHVYHADKIETMKHYAEMPNMEISAFPYIENRVLSLSPDEDYVLLEKTSRESVDRLAVEYHICRLDTFETTYLFDGFNTEHMISWLEDAFSWIDNDTLRIASWTNRYDELYLAEAVRKAEVFEVDISGDEVSVKNSDMQYSYSLKEWYIEPSELMDIKSRMEADMLLEDTYEVSRGSDLPDILISIIDTNDAETIKHNYGITYEYIIQYLNHIIVHGSTHSTVIGAWMHRIAAMKDTEKIDVVLRLLKEYDKDLYLDILQAVCTYSEGGTDYFDSVLRKETAPEVSAPIEPKYITETVNFDENVSLTYTYAENVKPGKISLWNVEGEADFPENGYYEEMQTHNGWRPAWATVTHRSILRRDSGDILIEYVDGDNNGPVIAFVRVSDKYMVEVAFSEGLTVNDAIVEELASTFVFEDLDEQKVEDWTFKYSTPAYDKWAETEGDYVIWEFTKNADGEFELTYSEGDVLCIPYITIGADKIVYATTKTQLPPADEIGKPHILKAHAEIEKLFQHDSNGGTVTGWPYSDDYNENGIYADLFAEYCASAPETAEFLREQVGELRDILRVYYNGEQVDGIGIALPDYYFIKEYQYEWQFIFSKSYAKEDVNTVRIELQIPDYLKSIYPENSLLLDLDARKLDSIESCTFIHEYMEEVQEKFKESGTPLSSYEFENNIAITDTEDLKLFEQYSYIGEYSGDNNELYAWPENQRITMTVRGNRYRLYLMQDNSIVVYVSSKGYRVYQAEEQYQITDEVFSNWILKYDEYVFFDD